MSKGFHHVGFFLFIIMLLPVFSLSLPALDPSQPISQYLVEKWGRENGLSNGTVTSIAQTSDGFLWLATSEGLFRFDGVEFSLIPFFQAPRSRTLKPIQADVLFFDKKKTLWIGSAQGLTAYNYIARAFKTFTSSDGLPAQRIRRIAGDMHGNIWISFWIDGVARLSGSTFTIYNKDSRGTEIKKINAIIDGMYGNLIFGSMEKGVYIFKDNVFSLYPIKDIEDIQVVAMEEDPDGNLWIGTENGLFKVNGSKITRYTRAEGLSNDKVRVILKDSEKNLWIGTDNGLNRIKRIPSSRIPSIETFLFPPYSASNFISSNNKSFSGGKGGGFHEKSPLDISFQVIALFEDLEKNLWIGTNNAGFHQIKDRKFFSYRPLDPYPGVMILSFFKDSRSHIWIGTMDGQLFHILPDETQPPQIVNLDKYRSPGITAIAEDSQGNVWLGTKGEGVFLLPQGSRPIEHYKVEDGLSDNTVTAISRDTPGNLWFATQDGITVYEMKSRTFHPITSRDRLPCKVVNNVMEDKNRDILVASDNGLILLSSPSQPGGSFRENPPPGPPQKLFFKLLMDVPVTCIYQDTPDPTVYWVATHGQGLKRLIIKDRKVISTASYTTPQGIPSLDIGQFIQDAEGNFWLMADAGVLRVSKTELNHVAAKKIQRVECIVYDESDGLAHCEFNNASSPHSILQTPQGDIWFNTKNRISIVNPGKKPVNKNQPDVIIDSITVNSQTIPVIPSRKNYFIQVTPIKPLSIQFTVPAFSSPSKIRFKYRLGLKGRDSRWEYLQAGKARAAVYNNLEPGEYTFTVTACNEDGVWNTEGETIGIILESRFYQTPLFKISVLVFLMAAAFSFVYLYKKRPTDTKDKNKNSPLDPKDAEKCIPKLEQLMKVEKLYTDPGISLQTLAERIPTTHHVLSRVLNEKLNRNFADYINFYRIEEAKRIIESSRMKELKNFTIANECGFNNLGVFYKAFKKFTGMTPGEYKKHLHE